MVSEAAVFPARAPARPGWNIAGAAFACYLLVIFVTLQPFATRDPVTLAGGESGFTGAGDVLRQVAYLGSFLFISFVAVRDGGFRALLCIPPLLAMLLGWCVLSATWAAAPDV